MVTMDFTLINLNMSAIAVPAPIDSNNAANHGIVEMLRSQVSPRTDAAKVKNRRINLISGVRWKMR